MTGSRGDSCDVVRQSMALAFEGPLKGTSTYNKQLSLRFVGRERRHLSCQRIRHPVRRARPRFLDAGKVNATWVSWSGSSKQPERTGALMSVVANGGQPGFAAYRRADDGYELHTLQIFTVTAEGITRNSVFQDAQLFTPFQLTPRLGD